jgi:hypothetical protein
VSSESEGMSDRSRLDAAMAGLDPWSRRLMQLWIDGKSHSEMATALGLTEEELLAALPASVQRLQEQISFVSPRPPPCP